MPADLPPNGTNRSAPFSQNRQIYRTRAEHRIEIELEMAENGAFRCACPRMCAKSESATYTQSPPSLEFPTIMRCAPVAVPLSPQTIKTNQRKDVSKRKSERVMKPLNCISC